MSGFIHRSVAIALVSFIALPTVSLAQDTGDGSTTPIDSLSNFALFSILSGFVGTYVCAFLNRVTWPDYVRFGTFFVWSVVVAAINAYLTRTLNFDDWVRSFLLVIVSGIAFYNLNKGSIKAFEQATS